MDSHPGNLFKPSPCELEDAMDLRSKRFLILYAKNLVSLKYRRTYLGFMWIVLEPAMYLIVLSIVFSVVNDMKIRDYALYLFSALIPWRYFEKIVFSAMESIVGGEWLLKKIYVAPLVFPLSQWIMAGIEFVFAFGVAFILFTFIKESWTIHLIIIPLAAIPWSLLGLGVGLICAVLFVFFRDIRSVVQMAVMFIFFSSPILFKADLFKGMSFQTKLMAWHPVSYLASLFQKPIYYSSWPDATDWMVSLGAGCFFFFAGYFLFKRFQNRFYFYL